MQILLKLLDNSLWREFDAHQNEMIITKIGRNLFPILEFSFKGLSEHSKYRIGITMEAMSFNKLKYTGGRWESLDVVEELLKPNEVFLEKSGRELLQRGLKLEKLKLTNSKDAVHKSDQMIRVQSMRQYIPTINLYEFHPHGGFHHVGKFQFPETKFIAVTAYQSDSVKHLKVQKNKFAQGFRDGAKTSSSSPSTIPTGTKRPTSTTSSNSSPDSTLSIDVPDFLLAKKERKDAPTFTTQQENVTPTSNFYHFPMPPFQGFQQNFQHSFQGFDANFNPANFWGPQNQHYDYHNNPYAWNQWS
ncbi:hypothetical protein CAEBREN_03038 [Caenorhabditis brenneri]|uniref:T-box domain-containing protein n=1 Tax=Caenorhabditis brenneri TaxID=135651 RepID=G0NBP3_CAEBE|nr:hypothetical protein CAEBREN_03038 [Caenorhabditis brenneri]